MSSPLIDPQNQRHVGQALIDFRSTDVFEALNVHNTPLGKDGFILLITPQQDVLGGDTVIAPGYSLDMGPQTVVDVIFSLNSLTCTETLCPGKEDVEKTISKMKQGGAETCSFLLSDHEDNPVRIHAVFAPVKVKAVSGFDSSDFFRGVNSTDRMIYSLAFAKSEAGILAPFQAIEDDVSRQTSIAIIVLCLAIALSTLAVVYLSNTFAASITMPMLHLLGLIRHINRGLVESEVTSTAPEIDREFGCREVRQISTTMEVLYKVVRDANIAFFAGNIETAFAVLIDSARLFERLGNDKAIGVSHNNLGNMMLTMYRTLEATGDNKICGFTKIEIVQKGVGYFHRAIKLGESAYDEFYNAEGWSPSCLEFMQHLSNRYFNRAMFLLTVKDCYSAPSELEELGCRDLQIVRDMDVEIADEGTQVGWNVRTVEQLFDVKLSRVKGHLQLLEMGYPDDWDVDELLEDLFEIVKQELKNENLVLFDELSSVGRMQQVECELIKYMLLKADLKTGAKVAIRMLVEDEYTLPEAHTEAVDALLAFCRSKDCSFLDSDVEHKLSTYLVWFAAVDVENDTRTSSISVESKKGDNMSEVFRMSTAKLTTNSKNGDQDSLHMSRRQSNRGDFTVEIF